MNSNAQVLKVGDLIISARGTVGEIAQVARPMAFNQSCYGLRGTSDIDNGYLLFALRMLTDQMKARSSGATFGSITIRILQSFYLPLPPKSVQRRIVEKIEEVEAEEIGARETATQARDAINAIVRQVYESNAPQRTIESVSRMVQYGLSKAMNEDGIGYKIFRMNEIIDGHMVDSGAMKCIDIDADEFATYRLNKGDVLFNRTNSIEHVGKTGLYALDGEHTFASYLVRIVPAPEKILPEFLARMMNAEDFQSRAKAAATRSINQANINATKMKNMEIPAPSLREQQALLDEIDKHERNLAAAAALIAAAPEKKRTILLDGIK